MKEDGDLFDEDLTEEFDTLIMTDDETGDDIEFVVIDKLEYKGQNYLLLVERIFMDEEESEALIFKETGEEDGNLTYVLLDDGPEFDKIAGLFQEKSDEYEVELD